MTSDATIERLHARFVEISKRNEPVRLVAHLWRKILASPEYNGDATALDRDARFVAWYLRKQIDADKRMPGALRLRNLLQEEQFFADLAEAQERFQKQYKRLLSRPILEGSASPLPAHPQPTPAPDEDAVRTETAAGLRALREQLAGRSAEEVEQLKSANAQKQLPGS